jgi:transcriptional regulator with XRE-family HTH domain
METEFGVPLRDFAKGRSQPELAELLGVTQSAVSQMLHSTRDIRVRSEGLNKYVAFEIRPIGSRRKQ